VVQQRSTMVELANGKISGDENNTNSFLSTSRTHLR
jgi:hypothetical protein